MIGSALSLIELAQRQLPLISFHCPCSASLVVALDLLLFILPPPTSSLFLSLQGWHLMMRMVSLQTVAVEVFPFWYLGRDICLAQTFFGLETREGSSRDFGLNLPATDVTSRPE